MEKEKTAIQELISKLLPEFFTEAERAYYLEMEKNQIRKAFNQGGKWASEIGSEEYYNQEYK